MELQKKPAKQNHMKLVFEPLVVHDHVRHINNLKADKITYILERCPIVTSLDSTALNPPKHNKSIPTQQHDI